MARPFSLWLAAGLMGPLLLSACEEGGPSLLRGAESADVASAGSAETRIVERDVEVPEVFQVTEAGLWDGRPSLGGVWVAYPDVTDPERVIIRNESNGKFVIGALFRRERENPGPALQISSDAAAALDMLAGAPATLNVTALRRQEVPIAEETAGTLEAVEDIETVALDEPEAAPVVAAAEPAADAADAGPALARDAVAAVAAGAATDPDTIAAATAEASGTTAPVAPVAPVRESSLSKPYIQIGLFGVEANANATAKSLRAQGIAPVIQERTYSGKEYWRVIAGPSATSAERSALLRKVKGLGFGDAYFVSK